MASQCRLHEFLPSFSLLLCVMGHAAALERGADSNADARPQERQFCHHPPPYPLPLWQRACTLRHATPRACQLSKAPGITHSSPVGSRYHPQIPCWLPVSPTHPLLAPGITHTSPVGSWYHPQIPCWLPVAPAHPLLASSRAVCTRKCCSSSIPGNSPGSSLAVCELALATPSHAPPKASAPSLTHARAASLRACEPNQGTGTGA